MNRVIAGHLPTLCGSSAFHHVPGVTDNVVRVKMRRFSTRRVIAGMADQGFSCWQIAIGQDIRKPVSQPILSIQLEQAIAVFVSAKKPLTTALWRGWSKFGPQSFGHPTAAGSLSTRATTEPSEPHSNVARRRLKRLIAVTADSGDHGTFIGHLDSTGRGVKPRTVSAAPRHPHVHFTTMGAS